jgi:hypothetical protein
MQLIAQSTYSGLVLPHRHETEKTILYRTLHENFETFVATAQSRTDKLPFSAHVFREVEAFLECGILANGFSRLQCESCKEKLQYPGQTK